MQNISFCDKCTVKKANKCSKNIYINPIFFDFDTLEHPNIRSSSRCDLLLVKDNELNFIEQKALDRFVNLDVNSEITKIFNSNNARSKIENSKQFLLEKHPEYENYYIKYFYIISDTLIDYFKKNRNGHINIYSIKLNILNKIFSPLKHKPVFHNGQEVNYYVDDCSNIKKYFPEA